jgi:signal transduction histidine kinase/putative methionine-R-sulfoxide reductase with GAF domain
LNDNSNAPGIVDIPAGEQLQKLRRELEAARKESSALMNACALLNTTLDLQKLLEIILQQSAVLTSAEASSLALIDQKTDELCFEVVVGEKKDILKEIRLPRGTGIVGWVALKGEPLLIEDVSKDSRFYQKVDEKSQFKTTSILCVPLKTKDGTIGALEVLNKVEGEKFDSNDQSLLMALASQAAMAIENARLYKSVLEEKNKIVSIVNSMGDGIIVTDENFDIVLTNPAAESVFSDKDSSFGDVFKLKVIMSELSQLKSDTTFDLVLMKPENTILSNRMTMLRGAENEITGSIVSMRNITDLKHRENIRAQFTSMMNYKIADQIQRLRESLKNNEIQCDGVKCIAESIEEKVIKLIQFSEMESGPLRLDRSLGPVGPVIESAMEEVREKYIFKHIELKFSCESDVFNMEVEVDHDRVKTILCLLLNNCIRFVSADGCVEVIVRNVSEMLEITVKDNGIGIKEELLPKLLDKQYHLENVLNSSDASLSLAYIKHVVEAHGGTMKINSAIGKGTEIIITMPKFIH